MPRDAGSDRDLIDELPALVWVARADGRVEWRNAPATGFSGLPMETIDADQLASIHPDDKAAVGSFLEQAIAAGEPFETEFRSLRNDGQYRWLLLRANPVRDDQQTILRWVAVVSDIHEQRRGFTVLETMFAEAPVALAFVDREYRLVRLNKAGGALFGPGAESVIAKRISEIVPELLAGAAADLRARSGSWRGGRQSRV